MTSKSQTTVTLTKDRETKNKVRYKASSDDVDTLYLGKAAAKKHGDKITVRIESA